MSDLAANKKQFSGGQKGAGQSNVAPGYSDPTEWLSGSIGKLNDRGVAEAYNPRRFSKLESYNNEQDNFGDVNGFEK
jgi:hypothetical protein